MEPLFKTQTSFDVSEQQRYANAVRAKRRLRRNILFAVEMLLYLLVLVLFRFTDAFWVACGLFFVALLFRLVPKIVRLKDSREVLEVLRYNEPLDFEFYDSHFVIHNSELSDKAEYAALHSIIESKTGFYFMLSKNNGIILSKKSCTPELAAFLQSVKRKYRK